MSDAEKPAFEIWFPETDNRIKIFGSGRTEGIEGAYCVINRIPLLEHIAHRAGAEYQRLNFGPELP